MLLSVVTIQAQDSSDESADSIEEVVTTARRRTESVSDVPIAISAFSGNDLEEKGINNIEFLEELVPGLSIGNSIFAQNSVAIGIRGLGATRSSAQWDQKLQYMLMMLIKLDPKERFLICLTLITFRF